MSDTTITKRAASNIGIVAQVLSLLMLAGVVAVFVVWNPKTQTGGVTEASWDEIVKQASEENAQADNKDETGADGSAESPFDRDAVVNRISLASKVRPPVVEEQPKDEGPQVADNSTPPAPAASEPQARFLGKLGSGDSSWALVAVGDAQKFIAPGATASFPNPDTSGDDASTIEVKVLTVAGDRVELIEDGKRRALPKAPRTQPAISVAKSDTPAAVSPEVTKGPAAEVPGRNGDIVSAERRMQTPRIQDFTDASGKVDMESYREALEKVREERSRMYRDRNSRGRARGDSGEDDERGED